MIQELTSVVDVSHKFSADIQAYIIFISIIFLLCFLFLGFQLLNIFKSLLLKIVDEIFKELADIKSEIKELKQSIR